MKLVKSHPLPTERGYHWSIKCTCGHQTPTARWCIWCEAKLPKYLVRKRDFLNQMCQL